MARDHGPSLVGGMSGNKLAYWLALSTSAGS
jgi:hypothetical protein